MNLGNPDRFARLEALAAEYALGTLPPRARRRLGTIARSRPDVAAVIRVWEHRLAVLAEAVPPVAPPQHVWAGIRQRLRLEEGGRTGSAPARLARAPRPWWDRVGLWQGFALACFAVAFAFGVTLFAPKTERPAEPIVVVLAGQDAKPVIIASAERGSRYLTLKAVAPVAIAPDRSLELWMLPDGANPRSLGLIPASGVGRVALQAPVGIALQNIPALAVSLEPAGGSPTGKPTGPVLYTGPVQLLF